MAKRDIQSVTATMIIPSGTEIEVDVHGQLSIRTPGNLVIENSGNYGTLESLGGSIRIEADADVEAVQVRCADVCYIEGSLTAWKVAAESIHLEEKARANIILQETESLEVGREARLVGNFSSEKELFLLFSRFAEQLRSLPLFADRRSAPAELAGRAIEREVLPGGSDAGGPEVAGDEAAEKEGAAGTLPDLPDPLFFALVLLEREFARSAYGPTSQRVIEELVKLLQQRDLETLRLTYRTLCGRIVEPGADVRRAHELMETHFEE